MFCRILYAGVPVHVIYVDREVLLGMLKTHSWALMLVHLGVVALAVDVSRID